MARVCFNKATVLPTAWGLDHLIFDGRGGYGRFGPCKNCFLSLINKIDIWWGKRMVSVQLVVGK